MVARELRCARTDKLVMLMGAARCFRPFWPGVREEIAAVQLVDIFVHMFSVGSVVQLSTLPRCGVASSMSWVILAVRHRYKPGSLLAAHDHCITGSEAN